MSPSRRSRRSRSASLTSVGDSGGYAVSADVYADNIGRHYKRALRMHSAALVLQCVCACAMVFAGLLLVSRLLPVALVLTAVGCVVLHAFAVSAMAACTGAPKAVRIASGVTFMLAQIVAISALLAFTAALLLSPGLWLHSALDACVHVSRAWNYVYHEVNGWRQFDCHPVRMALLFVGVALAVLFIMLMLFAAVGMAFAGELKERNEWLVLKRARSLIERHSLRGGRRRRRTAVAPSRSRSGTGTATEPSSTSDTEGGKAVRARLHARPQPYPAGERKAQHKKAIKAASPQKSASVVSVPAGPVALPVAAAPPPKAKEDEGDRSLMAAAMQLAAALPCSCPRSETACDCTDDPGESWTHCTRASGTGASDATLTGTG